MESITRLRKVGGSIMATIPKEIVDVDGFEPGERVRIRVEKLKKSFFGIAKGIGSLTKEDKRWMEGKNE